MIGELLSLYMIKQVSLPILYCTLWWSCIYASRSMLFQEQSQKPCLFMGKRRIPMIVHHCRLLLLVQKSTN